MKNIEILDCTLRDGGRVINCEFNNDTIIGLGKLLIKARVNIVELGFLRDNVVYNGNSTFFSKVDEAEKFIAKIKNKSELNGAKFVLFVDYGLYDVAKLEKANKNGITGIRFGFTKKNFYEKKEQLIKAMECIIDKGYDLYFQPVNTNGYNTRELEELIAVANRIHPVAFAIVDTYGAMYLEDLEQIWIKVDRELRDDISIDFHSHNNMQMSFALSQRLIQLSKKKRKLVIDATLNGMGKCAGNLNTELIVDYLVRKLDYNYDIDAIFDAIDQYLYPIKKDIYWGYSIPAFMAGIYKAHPNNVIYLTDKYRLNSKDIKYIISEIDEGIRQRYDYDNIRSIYRKYCATKINDDEAMHKLALEIAGKKVFVVAPGNSVNIFLEKIRNYILTENPIVICVNFVPQKFDYNYLFYANTIHWERICDTVDREKCILSSNITVDFEQTYRINYKRLIMEESFLCDNSTLMLLNLLNDLNAKEIVLAGFDGFKNNKENYINDTFPNDKMITKCEDINREVSRLFQQYLKRVSENIKVHFLTESIYNEVNLS